MAGEVRIGTSGWHYRHWRGPFCEERLNPSRMLSCLRGGCRQGAERMLLFDTLHNEQLR